MGDFFLDPVNLFDSWGTRVTIKAVDKFNETSLIIGDYEALIEATLDPYTAYKDAFYQFRRRATRR